jgi:hypothetical protein
MSCVTQWWARLACLAASAPPNVRLRLPTEEVALEHMMRHITTMKVKCLELMFANDEGVRYWGQRCSVGERDLLRVCGMTWIASLTISVTIADPMGLAPLAHLASCLSSLTIEFNACAPDLAPIGTLTGLRRLTIRMEVEEEAPAHEWKIGATIRPLSVLQELKIACRRGDYVHDHSVVSLAHDVPLFPASLTKLDLFGPCTQFEPPFDELSDTDDMKGWLSLLRLPLVELCIGMRLDEEGFTELLSRLHRSRVAHRHRNSISDIERLLAD